MSNGDNSLLYELAGIGKEFQGPTETIEVLRHVDLTVAPGDSLAVLGASGSGKTTLLHLLGTLDTPSRGDIRFMGRNVNELGPAARARLRNRDIGFVFQFHHLLPEFSAVENVAMPAVIAGEPRAQALAAAREALELVDMAHRGDHRVTTLSGGERQRTAIARAILRRPRVLLADEPTGNLDERTGGRIGDLLLRLNKDLGMTLIVVTHNLGLAGLLQRRLELRSGELYAQTG
ncbi:MAG: ABC transporter ATP-binding protein [Desulfovibrionaceae bacterium]